MAVPPNVDDMSAQRPRRPRDAHVALDSCKQCGPLDSPGASRKADAHGECHAVPVDLTVPLESVLVRENLVSLYEASLDALSRAECYAEFVGGSSDRETLRRLVRDLRRITATYKRGLERIASEAERLQRGGSALSSTRLAEAERAAFSVAARLAQGVAAERNVVPLRRPGR